MIVLPPWRPDVATANAGFAEDVRNVLPRTVNQNGGVDWAPFPDIAVVSDAANSQVLSGASFTMPDDTLVTVIGTATKLYILDATDNTLDDVSGTSYSAGVDARWDFEIYGQNIIAVNINDNPQKFEVGTDSAFSDLGGTPPKGKFVKVWRDQLCIGGLGTSPEGVRWSEINDITDWSGGNSDLQLFPGFGAVTAISRGNTNFVVQEGGIRRGIFVGGDTIFEFDVIYEDVGCRIPGACAFRDNRAYFLSDNGFKSVGLDGSIAHIGFRKLDQWAVDNINFGSGVYAEVDPVRPIIYWGITSSDETELGGINTIIAYNTQIDEWSRIDIDLECLFGWREQPWTLAAMDVFGTLADVPAPLDSPLWRNSFPVIGGANRSHQVGQFAGDNMAAKLFTGEFSFQEGRRSRLRTVRPLIDTNDITIRHYGRDNRANDYHRLGFQPVFSRTQEARINRSARFHRLEAKIPAGSGWTHFTGYEETVGDKGRW